MAPVSALDVKFEIGHVLFIDILGYSKLLINEQSEQIQKTKVRQNQRLQLHARARGSVCRAARLQSPLFVNLGNFVPPFP
jgi:hypothetical protein